MLVHIKNDPLTYAWGSSNGISELLGKVPSSDPEAELWLGSHPGSPSQVAKAGPVDHSLIELIDGDPDQYGVAGKHLPFLLKILAINAPLSLQAHPTLAEAAAGFAFEEDQGISRNASNRNYRDANHKPELVVALSKVTALSGFRSLSEAVTDLKLIKESMPQGEGRTQLAHGIKLLRDEPHAGREAFVRWALSPNKEAEEAAKAMSDLAAGSDPLPLATARIDALRHLATHHPADPGLLVSVLLHVVELAPGESIFLDAGNLHAYLSGLAIEIMAASDNVLRGGMTSKHIDVEELCRIATFNELEEPRFTPEAHSPGLLVWDPGVPDFRLLQAQVSSTQDDGRAEGAASSVTTTAEFPIVMVVTEGKVRIEREEAGVNEIVLLGRGQSLYASAGEPLTIVGDGQVYMATVGSGWAGGTA